MSRLKTLASGLLLCLMFALSPAQAGPVEAWAENERAMIEDVQESLHMLGYLTVDDVDGTMGPKTTLAIRRFESGGGMKQTGRVTADLHKLLLDLAFPDREGMELVGAVSVSGDGGWGGAYARYMVDVAMAMATRRCQQRSRDPTNCASHVTYAAGMDWIVSVRCGRFYSTSYGGTIQTAHDAAVQSVRGKGDRTYCSRTIVVNATFGEEIDEYERRMLETPAQPATPPPVAHIPVPNAKPVKGVDI